ncbi:MAG: MFS transporter [Chloroflexota bacterium]|nr:MFS transporter [Chloroflexota bacterium]
MASEAGKSPQPTTVAHSTAAALIARQDRISIWALPYLFVGIIGVGFLFTFFDIFDINVSFIQTCVQIIPNCTPPTSANYLGLPVLMNLIGYVIGTLILSPLADRFGRRDILLITMIITGIGSLYTAFVGDYTNLIIARTITGIGIGADLAIVNTYINEVAPSGGRAKYTSLIFIMSALGAFLGIWIGLYLTTPATPFPLGLPFAVASPSFETGWRVMYGIGALLALIGIILRFRLPESPRWLIARGRVDEAEQVVASMEARTGTRATELPAVSEIAVQSGEGRASYAEIFGNSLYLRRTILLLIVWFVGYITVYSIAAGLTSLLAGLQFPPPEAGLIAAVGAFGFILTAIFAYFFGERMERKYWLPVAAVLTLIGCLMIAFGGANNFAVAAIGSVILFFGFNLWVPMTYTWSTENYPTRARATGFALVDGVGHLGGGIGLVVIAPLIPKLGIVTTFLIIAGCLIVAAVIAQFGTNTRLKRLDEVSP